MGVKLYVIEACQDGQWSPKSLHKERNFRVLLNDITSLGQDRWRAKRVKTPEEAARLSKCPSLVLTTNVKEGLKWV